MDYASRRRLTSPKFADIAICWPSFRANLLQLLYTSTYKVFVKGCTSKMLKGQYIGILQGTNTTLFMELSQQIEGLLFYKAAPMKFIALTKIFDVSKEEIATALEALNERLQEGAVRLSLTDSEAQLVTASELDELIDTVRRDELKRDIGKAGAETLAIVLYKGPISRVEIDRIRGVNSAFILRNLMVRGLVEKGTEGKSHTFGVTPTLLAHLGITHKTELSNYATVLDQLEKFEQEQEGEEKM